MLSHLYIRKFSARARDWINARLWLKAENMNSINTDLLFSGKSSIPHPLFDQYQGPGTCEQCYQSAALSALHCTCLHFLSHEDLRSANIA